MRRGRSASASITAVAVLGLLGASIVGCGSPVPSAAPVIAPSATAPSTEPPATTPSAPASVAGPVARDDALLSILPPDLDGNPVTPEDASFAEAATDPAFARNVGRAAFGIVVAAGDLASGVIAELVPGVYSDAFFRDWRDSYNEGACSQAGGVVGNAEAEMDGRTVYIASCSGGLRVYHAYLEERNVVVSLFSVGDGRFGERLMRDLRP